MSNDETIHVLIAHGNQLVGAGLVAAFSPSATLPRSAVAVTDYETGVRLLEDSDVHDSRVLTVTDDNSEVSIRRAVELDAKGYMALSSAVNSIIRAVREIYRGGSARASQVSTAGDDRHGM